MKIKKTVSFLSIAFLCGTVFAEETDRQKTLKTQLSSLNRSIDTLGTYVEIHFPNNAAIDITKLNTADNSLEIDTIDFTDDTGELIITLGATAVVHPSLREMQITLTPKYMDPDNDNELTAFTDRTTENKSIQTWSCELASEKADFRLYSTPLGLTKNILSEIMESKKRNLFSTSCMNVEFTALE